MGQKNPKVKKLNRLCINSDEGFKKHQRRFFFALMLPKKKRLTAQKKTSSRKQNDRFHYLPCSVGEVVRPCETVGAKTFNSTHPRAPLSGAFLFPKHPSRKALRAFSVTFKLHFNQLHVGSIFRYFLYIVLFSKKSLDIFFTVWYNGFTPPNGGIYWVKF